MVINRYAKGAKRERKIVNEFRSKGWIALRSAGSHSPIDVIAINPETKEIKLIQSKVGNLAKSIGDKIKLEGQRFIGQYQVNFELWN